MENRRFVQIENSEELRGLIGEPLPRVKSKDRSRLLPQHKDWLAACPFCLVATAGADGSCDVSPKGDPPGFTHIVDDVTIAIPERPGNRRADGLHNVLSNAHVGLIFVIPGRGDTLRINGRARLLRDAPFFDEMVVRGHRPRVALLVEIEQIFFHCSKAFLRSDLWQPESWQPEAIASRARIAKALERPDESLVELERYYGSEYAKRLYE
jgi:PPOX class probable FMN-dependent enzyme